MEAKKKTFTSRQDPRLIKAIRILALEEDKTAEELVTEALIDLLHKHGKKWPLGRQLRQY